jgi:hypothetical protein
MVITTGSAPLSPRSAATGRWSSINRCGPSRRPLKWQQPKRSMRSCGKSGHQRSASRAPQCPQPRGASRRARCCTLRHRGRIVRWRRPWGRAGSSSGGSDGWERAGLRCAGTAATSRCSGSSGWRRCSRSTGLCGPPRRVRSAQLCDETPGDGSWRDGWPNWRCFTPAEHACSGAGRRHGQQCTECIAPTERNRPGCHRHQPDGDERAGSRQQRPAHRRSG